MECTTLKEYFQKRTSEHPFEVLQHVEITHLSPGHMEIVFHSDKEKHSNPRGNMYGGVHVSLSDYLMGAACVTLGKSVTTAQIGGNYIKSLSGSERLRGVSRVEHNGGTTMVTSCRLYNESGDLVYMGTATFIVVDTIDLPDLPWSQFDEEEL